MLWKKFEINVPDSWKDSLRCYLSHWLTFRSDITVQSTIKIFSHTELKLKNGEILINPLKVAKTPKMGLISISNDKKVVWTKFEQIPFENKSFEIFIPETPDLRPTFGKFALTAFREPKSTYLFYNHIFFCFKTFIFSWKTEKISNTKKVMAPGSYSKKFFGISAFQWGIDFFWFFKNYISEWLGLPEWKKYISMQKFRVVLSKLSD